MKKCLLIFIFVCVSVVFIKYFFSGYDLKYVVDGYNVETIYKDNRLYYEINDKYNFDIYKNSYFKKIVISEIKKLNVEGYECIYPIIKNMSTVPLCYKDGRMIDYNLIDNEEINKYKKNGIYSDSDIFKYYGNLGDTYVALWNYKGYYIMNGKEYENVVIFDNDRYDNSLSFMHEDIIYMPDYSQDHVFNTLIALNVKSKKIEKIKLSYNIDYDSYLVGENDNKMYIFDNKYSILYELDYKKNNMSIKGSNKFGYTKYVDGKEIICSKSEYKVDKIKYNNKKSIYNYYFEEDKLYRTMNDNKKIVLQMLDKNSTIISEYKNNLYYVYDNSLFKYSSVKSEKIFYFNELEFNKDNTIFVYSY